MGNKKKLLKGFRDIHRHVPGVNGEYTAIKLQNAVSNETTVKYESEQEWASDRVIDTSYDFAGGDGKLVLKGIDAVEHAALYEVRDDSVGGILLNANDIGKEGAFTYEKRKKNGHRRLYVVYNAVCAPYGLAAETIEEGKGSAEKIEIEYTVGTAPNGDIYWVVDTETDTDVPADVIENWHVTPQFSTKKTTPAQQKK